MHNVNEQKAESKKVASSKINMSYLYGKCAMARVNLSIYLADASVLTVARIWHLSERRKKE